MTWAAVYPKSSEPVTHYYHAHQVWAWKGVLGLVLHGMGLAENSAGLVEWVG